MPTASQALNRLAKWRSIFAGWQLGTRMKGDAESDAVRDHRELTILLRAEVNAITSLLIRKGVFTAVEYDATLADEAEALDKSYSDKFPGITSSDHGMVITAKAAEYMRSWRP